MSRAPARAELGSPAQRILDVSPLVPPAGALTGWAAAFVQGVETLDGLSWEGMRPQPIAICCGTDLGRRSPPMVRYSREHLAPEERRLCHGLRVVSPLRAAFDGARLSADLEAAVVFVDAMSHARQIRTADLKVYVTHRAGWKGVQQARHAVAMADPAARSPGESRLRVSFQVDAGLPRPEVNMPIFDLEERLIGIADLFDEAAGLVTEYDGALHRKRQRHHDDNVREEAFEGANLVVARVDAIDLNGDRAQLARRLQASRARGLARDRTRDHWTTREPEWWVAQQDPLSLLSPEQVAELMEDVAEVGLGANWRRRG